MARWIASIGLVLAALLVAAWLLVGWLDLGPFAARRASAALGRAVTIGALHVTPGRWITIELRDGRLDNLPGGSRPAMAEVASMAAEVEALSLLRGPLVIRRLAVDGLRVLLERNGEQVANWKFGPDRPASPGPGSRAWFPTLLDAGLTGSEIVFRTSSGTPLRIRLDAVTIRTAGADQPVRLASSGAYNDAPITLDADLASFAALRDAATPYGADLRAASGDTTLRFQGTMAEPLDLDGVRGTLVLVAPTPAAILAIAGVSSELDLAIRLSGTLEHAGPVWTLADASGALEEAAVTASSLRFVEGARGEPDNVAVEMAFDRLDLNALLGEGRRGARTNADLPLAVDRAPDTLVSARLSARELVYAAIRAADVELRAALTSGRVALEELSLTYLGARVKASGQVESDDGRAGGRVSAAVAVSGMDVQALRRALGIARPLPLLGRMDGEFAVAADGTTLNAAARGAHASAVVAMRGGSIAREVIEVASIDVRELFRKARGMSAISCLVGVLDMRAGAGTVSPLRIRSERGTVAGNGWFDLNRHQLDLTIGSESATTSSFALDVPVRVSGSFADPKVRPARWSAAGRALLAASDDVGRLLPGLRPFARRSPCFSSRRSR